MGLLKKFFFNRRVRKGGAEYAKLKQTPLYFRVASDKQDWEWD